MGSVERYADSRDPQKSKRGRASPAPARLNPGGYLSRDLDIR
jgi:hypothetical protein